MNDVLYKDVSITAEHHDGVGVFHYARVVFDWSADHLGLVQSCAPIGRMETVGGGASVVYVIGPEDGDHCKIGITDNIADRLSGLQTGCWERLKVHHVVFVYDGKAYDVEQCALGLALLRGAEVRGEWVGLSPSKACGLIIDAAEITKADAGDFSSMQETMRQIAASRHQSLSTRERQVKAEKFRRMGY